MIWLDFVVKFLKVTGLSQQDHKNGQISTVLETFSYLPPKWTDIPGTRDNDDVSVMSSKVKDTQHFP